MRLGRAAILGDAGRDAGYWSTARMILEAGLTAALQEKDTDAEGLPRVALSPLQLRLATCWLSG